jgi:hypothetical protein
VQLVATDLGGCGGHGPRVYRRFAQPITAIKGIWKVGYFKDEIG